MLKVKVTQFKGAACGSFSVRLSVKPLYKINDTLNEINMLEVISPST